MLAVKEVTMARRDDKTVKIERPIATKLAFVADRRGVTVAELVSDLLREPADRMWQEELAKFQAEQGQAPETGKRKGGK